MTLRTQDTARKQHGADGGRGDISDDVEGHKLGNSKLRGKTERTIILEEKEVRVRVPFQFVRTSVRSVRVLTELTALISSGDRGVLTSALVSGDRGVITGAGAGFSRTVLNDVRLKPSNRHRTGIGHRDVTLPRFGKF